MGLLHCYVAIVIMAFFQLRVHTQGRNGVTVACKTHQCHQIVVGVQLSLRGAAIANDGYVDVDNIGHGNEDALLCHTNKTACCGGNNLAGDWYFPNRTQVGSATENSNMGRTSYFFRNRGDSVVRLRRLGIPTERGRFYCQIPNANNDSQTIYVNIG